MRDCRASPKHRRHVNRFRQFRLSRTGLESRLPVNLDAVSALSGKRNGNCHKLLDSGS